MTRPASSTPHPRSAAIQSRRISRIPAFTPVPAHSRTGRARRDGWTPHRQAEFIGWLAETRCVRTAAAKVGMSREGAYRLRRKRGAEGFCAAWDCILGGGVSAGQSAPETPQRKVTLGGLMQRIRHGTYRPVMRAGRYIGTERKADSSALFGMLKRADRRIAPAPAAPPGAKNRSHEKGRCVSTAGASWGVIRPPVHPRSACCPRAP